MGRDDKIRGQWNRAVDSWVEFVRGGKDYFREFMNGPALKRMMGCVGGMRVLDIACGEGYFSRLCAEEGACVTGVDFSERMINAAVEEEKRNPFGVEYHVADASDLSILESGSFDVAFSFMALMDMEDYESTIGEASRVLKPGGRFVFAITHPCFESRSLDGADVCVGRPESSQTALSTSSSGQEIISRGTAISWNGRRVNAYRTDSRRPFSIAPFRTT